MTALLTDNLPLLAGAPNGIKKLRELILELAVRGKLVEQDASDEPASELLKRIAAEKARLVAEGKIKKQKDLADASEPVITFPLPVGWAATSIGEATICRDGERVPVSQAEREGRDKVFDYYGASGVIDKIDGYLFDKPLLLVGEDGANLINRSTPIAFMARGRYWVNNHAHVLDGISEELLLFIELYFNAIDLKPYVTGTAQPKMNQSKMNGIAVALPPVAEQHRIVAKVDELMALCDRLEAQQADAASAHAQLVQALLGSLTQASDATEFAANWQCLAEHFHTLFSTEPSIDALKQTLLQLAVMGKLVPQDPTDEPASELLSRIQSEKQRLVAEGKLKKQKPLAEISEQEKAFELPQGWEWVRLDYLLKKIGAGSTPLGGKQGYVAEGIKFLRSQNVWNEGLRLDGVALIAELTHQKMSGTHVGAGDLLFNITGASIGRCAIVPDDFDTGNVSQHVTIVRPVAGELRHFLHVVLTSQLVQQTVMDVQVGVSREGLSIGKLAQFVIPCPPDAEQHRIVAKVDQLMALCDQLKTQLSQARQLNQQLASTLVEQAVA